MNVAAGYTHKQVCLNIHSNIHRHRAPYVNLPYNHMYTISQICELELFIHNTLLSLQFRVYVCMYVRMYIYIYIYICIFFRVCTYIHVWIGE